MVNTPAITAEGVVRRYGTGRGLDGLDLVVPSGLVFGLLGPNGSGKSTFLALIAGATAPDAGALTVLGTRPGPALRRRIGVVFQENTSDPFMSPLETLLLVGRLYGITGRGARERAGHLLGAVGLAGRADDRIGTLSGGMRRRVELARSLMHVPELLLLDEPTTGVDPDERRAFWSSLRAGPDRPNTVVLATNDLGEADAVCDEVAFLREGMAVAAGQPARLKEGLAPSSVRVTYREPLPSTAVATARALADVATATVEANELRITTSDPVRLVSQLFSLQLGEITNVSFSQTTLEEAYFAAVGQRSEVTP